jgi:hypothetical protein
VTEPADIELLLTKPELIAWLELEEPEVAALLGQNDDECDDEPAGPRSQDDRVRLRS